SALSHAIERALASAGAAASDVGAVAASASGHPVQDVREARAIRAVVGDVPVTATKSVLGETLGASGAVRTIALPQSLRRGTLPGVGGLGTRDPDADVNVAPTSRPLAASRGLVTAMAIEGNCCALMISI